MKTYTIDEAAAVLKASPRSLADKRYRMRLGLVARKIGRRIVFTQEDIQLVLDRGKEPLPDDGLVPVMGRREQLR